MTLNYTFIAGESFMPQLQDFAFWLNKKVKRCGGVDREASVIFPVFFVFSYCNFTSVFVAQRRSNFYSI